MNMENRPQMKEMVSSETLAKEFDKETFDAASAELASELTNANQEMRSQILLERFIDCAPDFLSRSQYSPRRETKLFDRFGFRPMGMNLEKMESEGLLIAGEYRPILLGKANNQSRLESKGVVYGGTTIFYLAPNELVETEVGEGDIVSTAKLSGCSVLILRGGSKITMAHITTPQEIFDATKTMITAGKKVNGEVILITPEFFAIPGNKDSELTAKEFTNKRNALLENVQQFAGAAQIKIKTGGYPYVSADAYRDRRINEMAVVVSKNTCDTIGYAWKTSEDQITTFNFFQDTAHTV